MHCFQLRPIACVCLLPCCGWPTQAQTCGAPELESFNSQPAARLSFSKALCQLFLFLPADLNHTSATISHHKTESSFAHCHGGAAGERAASAKKMTLTCPVSFPLHRKAFTARVAALLFTVQHRHRHRLKAGLDGLLLIFFHFCQSLLLLAISRAQVQGCADCLCFKTIRRKKK